MTFRVRWPTATEPDRRGDRYAELLAMSAANSSEQNDLALSRLNLLRHPTHRDRSDHGASDFVGFCTGCHVDLPSASHALSNTTVLGEACAVCHASGAVEAVDQVHAQY